MDLEFSPEDLAFQDEVRAFLRDNYPDHIREATVFVDAPPAMAWKKILVEKDWAVPGWPEEWGGTNWTPTQKYIRARECGLAGTPAYNPLSLQLLAPVLFGFGSQEQQQEYLPKMEAAHRSCSATLSPRQCWAYRPRATRLQATGGNRDSPPSEEKRFGLT